jgi:hypothetical protein
MPTTGHRGDRGERGKNERGEKEKNLKIRKRWFTI